MRLRDTKTKTGMPQKRGRQPTKNILDDASRFPIVKPQTIHHSNLPIINLKLRPEKSVLGIKQVWRI